MFEWLRRIFKPPESDLERELRDWRIVDAVNAATGQAAVFRLRVVRPRLENIAAFRFAVRVLWPYESDSPMPSKTLQKEQEAFDIALDELTGSNGYAELVRVATGNGLKEWLFYTTDVQTFGENFNRLLTGKPEYPVSLEFEEDPQWLIWSDFVASVSQESSL